MPGAATLGRGRGRRCSRSKTGNHLLHYSRRLLGSSFRHSQKLQELLLDECMGLGAVVSCGRRPAAAPRRESTRLLRVCPPRSGRPRARAGGRRARTSSSASSPAARSSRPIAAGRSLRASALRPADSSRSGALRREGSCVRVDRPEGLAGSGRPARGGTRRSLRIRAGALRLRARARRQIARADPPASSSGASDRRRRGSARAGTGTPRLPRSSRASGRIRSLRTSAMRPLIEGRIGRACVELAQRTAVEDQAFDRGSRDDCPLVGRQRFEAGSEERVNRRRDRKVGEVGRRNPVVVLPRQAARRR